MAEYVQKIQMPPGSCHRKQRHNSTTEKVEKSEIELGLPFMVPDLVQRFQMIF